MVYLFLLQQLRHPNSINKYVSSLILSIILYNYISKMKKIILTCLTIFLFSASAKVCYGQTPAIGRSWKYVATQMPDTWYGSDESKIVAENVLLYQRDAGGWPKNIAMHKPLTEVEKAKIGDEKGNNDAILDNDATTTEMKFMAKMYNSTRNEAYKVSFNRGLSFILDAQYENGGWPMFYPPRKGYYTHITFNDNAIVNILNLLRDVFEKKPIYYSITTTENFSKARPAYNKGIECILKTQIMVKGKPTVWCAQHDEVTLLPAKARSYELPSFSGGESVGIIKHLMEIPDPTPAVIKSVQSAMEWLDSHRLKNTRWEYFTNKDGQRDRRIVFDPKAGDLWARFYDLDTEQPYVCDRDGIKKKTLEEIGYERRNGYSWYTDAPKEVMDLYPAWKAKWVK
jgi:PelA/Pel-15E family pectate lyase